MNDYNVLYLDLPHNVKAITSKNEYGQYVIIVNSRLDNESQKKGYEHEMGHIQSGDYDLDSVEEIEVIRHANSR